MFRKRNVRVDLEVQAEKPAVRQCLTFIIYEGLIHTHHWIFTTDFRANTAGVFLFAWVFSNCTGSTLCAWAFFSCSKVGLLSSWMRGLLVEMGSLAAEREL